ncbi:head GIN domain-containing protein [Pedobacter sp. AW31-3R]|uniref:head GIN domain-containing protein n=1 Tax=Pedobacter sp. AW31-3R TaxID=3445781 RepID=UPI003F9FFFD1
MKKLNTLLLLVLMSMYHIASAKEPVRTGNASLLQEEKPTGSFKGIAGGGPINIKVTLGNKEAIRLEGDQDAIDDLVTEVEKGVLIIRPSTRKWNDWSRRHKNARVTAYITAKKLTSLTMSGSGSLTVENTISTAELVATLSGSGNIKAAANCKSFVGVISGSGSLNVQGQANESNLTISGSGNFAGKSFSVDHLSAQISGSASIYIRAQKSIEAVISGSGNILYTGDATITKTIIGSGRIKKVL